MFITAIGDSGFLDNKHLLFKKVILKGSYYLSDEKVLRDSRLFLNEDKLNRVVLFF